MLTGTFTALVTPMREGAIDSAKLAEFVEWQIGQGVEGLVPCGTTGETPTLSDQEIAEVIRTVVQQARKRVPVIAGAGANSTAKAIAQSKLAVEAGADALLHVTPYYNKPTQAGLLAHYRTIVEAVDRPIVIYNVPGRTGGDIQPQTVAELARMPGVVAIKEATGSLIRGTQVIAACGADLAVLSGDDFTCVPLTFVGGQGVISVVSNLCPKMTSEMIAAARRGEVETARTLHHKLFPLMELLFIESNPIPVKAGVSLLGYTENELRLPLQPLAGEKLERLRAEMQRLGLLG